MNIVIIAGSGGIGQAFVKNLTRQDNVHSIGATCNPNQPKFVRPQVSRQSLDVTHEPSVQVWSETLGEIDWLINAAGILRTPASAPKRAFIR
ncbi:MAG: hypothetical protein OES09_13550 [Gammaproteobacteria bacterium]|nr:hypothetical protein [Gammaproteobacteria bacterium]